MSPPHIHDRERESNMCLRICKDSHLPMKKSSSTTSSLSSSSSSSSSASSSSASAIMSGLRCGPVATRPPPARQQPVIIYTHSPKVIHTHPRDFMALVQKLTGLYRLEGEEQAEPAAPDRPKPNGPNPDLDLEENKNNVKKLIEVAGNNNISNNDEIESSSVITEENSKNNIDDHHLQMINHNPNFIPPISYEPLNPYMNSFSMFNPNSNDFVCPNQSNFYSSYGDRLLFAPQNDETQFNQMPLWR